MARAGRFRIGAMEALWAQLQFAPAAAAQRMVGRIRSLIATVGPDTLHSPAAVVREVVRFPVEQVPGDADAMFVGSALRADLAELCLRLSRRAPAASADGIELADAARVCGVSVRTLRRWREQGLLLHWIGDGRSGVRVGVLRRDLDAFTQANGDLLARAARFTQLSAPERASIRASAKALGASGLSERRVISQVAREHGRAAGTVRSIVVPVMERSRSAARRADASAARAARLWSLWRRGVQVGAAARHLGISDRMAQHALRRERARRLAAMRERIEVDAHGLDPSLVTGAEWACASSGLAVFAPPADAGGWFALRGGEGTPRPRSGTLAVVMRALLSRAAATASLPAARCSAAALDRAETDIRWAARILITLVADAMPAIDARVRVWSASGAGPGAPRRAHTSPSRAGGGLGGDGAGAPIARLPTELAVRAICAVREACAADISSLRSGRTRIERLASAQMDLALARMGHALSRDAADARRAMERAAPWTALAPLDDARAAHRGLLASAEHVGTARGMAQRRYGWHGGAPQTIDEIAAEAQRPAWVVAAAIGRVLRGVPRSAQ